MVDGRFCTQVLLREVKVKPGGGSGPLACREGAAWLKESLGAETGAACGPEGIRIPSGRKSIKSDTGWQNAELMPVAQGTKVSAISGQGFGRLAPPQSERAEPP